MTRLSKLLRKIAPLSFIADWTGGNPMETPPTPQERPRLKIVPTLRTDEKNRGIGGDLDDINPNKKSIDRKLS
jgi:hypothetical protein